MQLKATFKKIDIRQIRVNGRIFYLLYSVYCETHTKFKRNCENVVQMRLNNHKYCMTFKSGEK